MTKQQQTTANIKLLDKLTGYLADHPQEELGEDISLSYVMFSSTSGELNEMNEVLLKTLLNIIAPPQQLSWRLRDHPRPTQIRLHPIHPEHGQ